MWWVEDIATKRAVVADLVRAPKLFGVGRAKKEIAKMKKDAAVIPLGRGAPAPRGKMGSDFAVIAWVWE